MSGEYVTEAGRIEVVSFHHFAVGAHTPAAVGPHLRHVRSVDLFEDLTYRKPEHQRRAVRDVEHIVKRIGQSGEVAMRDRCFDFGDLLAQEGRPELLLFRISKCRV
jgi:hypothetical protein